LPVFFNITILAKTGERCENWKNDLALIEQGKTKKGMFVVC
jgi:hypothetical protein